MLYYLLELINAKWSRQASTSSGFITFRAGPAPLPRCSSVGISDRKIIAY